MKYILLLLLVFKVGNSFCLTIEGKVIDGFRKRTMGNTLIQLVDTANSVKAEMRTDINGVFKFQQVVVGVYAIRVKRMGCPDTIYAPMKVTKDTLVTVDVHRFCKYDAYEYDKKCPKCHKRKSVIPVIYGFIVSKNGKHPLKGEGVKYKLGGCLVSNCEPHWYCKRDHIWF